MTCIAIALMAAALVILGTVNRLDKVIAFSTDCLSQSPRRERYSSFSPSLTNPVSRLKVSSSRSDDVEYDSDDVEGDGYVTREMLQRDMLGEPTVLRKKKNGKKGYRVLDNRDNLPFVVKLMTPDPYTKVQIKRDKAKKLSKRSARMINDVPRRKDLVGMENTNIAASIYAQMSNGSLEQILGQFFMDKSTTSGDVIKVGDVEYEVQKARCQYKYAGGKRFVMVRKILEVKEVERVAQENALREAF